MLLVATNAYVMLFNTRYYSTLYMLESYPVSLTIPNYIECSLFLQIYRCFHEKTE